MGITGLNLGETSAAISKVAEAYKDIHDALISDSKTSFVEPMSSLWGSPEAVNFFTAYASTIASLSDSVNNTFNSVVVSMNSAANNLASIGGATWDNPLVEGQVVKKNELDTTSIKSDLNGVVGVDGDAASTLADSAMTSIETKIVAGLEKACNAVNTSGFVGAAMQDHLVTSLKNIKNHVEMTFDDLKSKVKKAITDTEEAYKTTSSNIESAFSGSGSSSGASDGGKFTNKPELM